MVNHVKKFRLDDLMVMPCGTMRKLCDYNESYNEILSANLPTYPIIYNENGLKKHIIKHHSQQLKYINDETLRLIIEHPDYIGQSPKEPDGMEFIKKLSEFVVVAIKLSKKDNYYYVATMYSITESKLNRRINSGRLIKLDKIE